VWRWLLLVDPQVFWAQGPAPSIPVAGGGLQHQRRPVGLSPACRISNDAISPGWWR